MKGKRTLAFSFTLLLSLVIVNYNSIREVINWHRQEALSEAAWNGDIKRIKLLLLAGADVNSCVSEGGCPLITASSGGQTETVRFLLDKGGNINIRNENGRTALTDAVYNNHIATVRLLLSRGADVNARADGYTLLDRASHKGQTEVASLLLANGAGSNGDSDVALRIAIINHHPEIVKLLLDKGIDVNKEYDSESHSTLPSALHLAIKSGSPEMIKMLKQAGAKR